MRSSPSRDYPARFYPIMEADMKGLLFATVAFSTSVGIVGIARQFIKGYSYNRVSNLAIRYSFGELSADEYAVALASQEDRSW